MDKHDFDDRLSKAYTRVRSESIQAEEINNFDGNAAKIIYDIINCTRCNCCDAVCPTLAEMPDKFVGPATLVAVARRYYDTFDQADRVLEAVSKGLFYCTLCGKCDTVCLRPEVKHVDMYKELMAEAEMQVIKPSYADSIKRQ